jgi:protein gp37
VSAQTSIEWTDATWNPVTGCSEVSPGCDHCYAKTFAERWRSTPGHYFENGFDVQLRPDKLALPLSWKKPRRIFVNSMSDLFHDKVPDEYIAKVFGVMAAAPQHTYQILTKRHGRMRSLLSSVDFANRALDLSLVIKPVLTGMLPHGDLWPLPNVWLGVSVENQQWADIRVPALLDTPAAVRWLSCEPLLGPVKLPFVTEVDGCTCSTGNIAYEPHEAHCGYEPGPAWGELHWVVAGGESGIGHRLLDLNWVRSLRDQCTDWNVPFLFKQVGGRTPKAGGRELDGRTWDQYPERAA